MSSILILSAMLMTAAPPADKDIKEEVFSIALGMSSKQYVKMPPTAGDMVWQATINCRNSKKKGAEHTDLLWQLTEIEEDWQGPIDYTGMLLASACHESGFNRFAKGDFSKKGHARAIGLFQLWPWWVKRYKIDRTNPEASANAYLQHIARQLPKVKKNCKFRSKNRLWRAAWVHAIRFPKKGGRCYETTKHERLLNRWKRNIRKHRRQEIREMDDCLDNILDTHQTRNTEDLVTIFFENCRSGC